MNEGTVHGRTAMNAAERIVKKHGGSCSAGEWSHVTGLDEAKAASLVDELQAANYQVRNVDKKTNEVTFR